MSRDPDPQLPDTAVSFLRTLLWEQPAYPSVALWRCWEMALFAQLRFEGPLLDLGCGDGGIVEHLRRSWQRGGPAPDVVGLDINASSAALVSARSTYGRVVVADARSLPFPDVSFGAVVSVCVLEHIPQVERVLVEVCRTLRPGGLFAFSTPTPRLLEMAAETHPGDPRYPDALSARLEHVNTWEPSRWHSLLRQAGLGVVDAVGFMGREAAHVWFGANDWVERPIRGRGVVYRMAGPGLRRFGLGQALARYWFRRLRQAAVDGIEAPLEKASAALIVASKAGPE